MSRLLHGGRAIAALIVSTSLVIFGWTVTPAAADTAPAPGVPKTASNDVLPTVQIDGVVWTQAVVGNTVYVGGDFQTARPAGAAVGEQTVVRKNLLAFDVRTGELINSFVADTNGKVLAITPSPDGKRLYVGGLFTTVNGINRYRIAALNPTTGAVDTSFQVSSDYVVRAIAATPTTVYLGGQFSSINGNPRVNLAAVNASNGTITQWAPTADNNQVLDMVLTPDGSKVVISGSFTSVNGNADGYGMAALDPTTGALQNWIASKVSTPGAIRNGGTQAAIYQLSTDANTVYGVGYHFGSGGTMEGPFALEPADGAIRWLQDCHGDGYDVAAAGDTVYAVGHAHFCGNTFGMPQTNPWTFQRALSLSKAAGGVNQPNSTGGYANHGGQPSSQELNWYPNLKEGTFTGQAQAAWSVVSAGDYVILGGEFPRVNGVNQQGLVRFSSGADVAKKSGPVRVGVDFTPTLQTLKPGEVRISFPANWDRDNEALTYRIYRDYDLAKPIFEKTVSSKWWDVPVITYTDTGLQPGKSYGYHVRAFDANGNFARGDQLTATAGSASQIGDYAQRVLSDAPNTYWRASEASGTAVASRTEWNPATTTSGTVRGVPGALAGDTDTAMRFDGTSTRYAYSNAVQQAPDKFSAELWFKTTTTRGGLLLGFGNSQTGTSGTKDRMVYMLNNGRLNMTVNRSQGGNLNAQTTTAYNDGKWHHTVMTFGPGGMRLMVDGKVAAENVAVKNANNYAGFWRIGGGSLSGLTSRPTSDFFAGDIDDVAIYPYELTVDQANVHSVLGATGQAPNVAPTAAFTASATKLKATFDASASTDTDGTVAGYSWDFGDGTSGTGKNATHTYAAAGTYPVTLTVTDDDGTTATTTKDVTAVAPLAIAKDSFSRSVTGGWGTADVGGPWTISGGAANFSVANGEGRMKVPTAGWTTSAVLAQPATDTADIRTTFAIDGTQAGGGTSVWLVGRRVNGTNSYRALLKIRADRQVEVYLVREVAGNLTYLSSRTLPGYLYTPGQQINVRMQVTGKSPTNLAVKLWDKGTTEPTDWTLQRTDTAPELQTVGGFGFYTYVSATNTGVPISVGMRDFEVVKP